MCAGMTAPNSTTLTWLEGEIALIYLGGDDERVISLTDARLTSFQHNLEAVAARPAKGLVISGPSEEMFTVGADINAIGSVNSAALGKKLAQQGQDVFAKIAALKCPSVAAISGPCIGGGCELALACTYRLISDHPSSQIGLPEIKLGIIPGFGGTQRLPRLIGVPRALDIILAGKTLKPKQAKKAGLVDEVCSAENILERAINIARGIKPPERSKPRLLDRILSSTTMTRSIVKRRAKASVQKETKGFYPAPLAALESVFTGLDQGIEVGLDFESSELGRMIVTPQCRALVQLFFLTEAAKGLGKAGKKHLNDLSAMVIGAGAMGAGIASVLAKSGTRVILKDNAEAGLQRGLAQIRQFASKLRYLAPPEQAAILNRVEGTTFDSAAIASVNIVIEAIFEDLNLKTRVLSEIAAKIPESSIIASNTSSLSVSTLAANLPKPGRVLGMHFFNPVDKMPLVEIVRAKQTEDRAIIMVAALATKLGKFPIVVQDVPGFLINRILTPYLNEASFLLAEGYSVEAIDKAATSFGMPMGPLRLLDEVGLDVAAHVSEIMAQGYGERMKAPGHAAIMVQNKRFGKKSGLGFYDFSGDAARVSPDVRDVLKVEAAPKDGGDLSEISDRLVLALINEAVLCLDQGVAGAPGRDAANQINLGSVMGFGFPPFRGGVLFYADQLGSKIVAEKLTKLAQRFERIQVAPGIIERAQRGGGFC